MLKQITIKGFKGITDLTLNLDKINVLIGVNSSEKHYSASIGFTGKLRFRDVAEYLKIKIEVSDIKSQISKSPFLSYKSIFEFEEKEQPFLLIWDIEFKLISATSVNLLEESISKVNSKWDKSLCNPKRWKSYMKASPLYTYKMGL